MNSRSLSSLIFSAIFVVFAISIVFRVIWLDRIPGINGDEAWLGCKAFDAAMGGKLDWHTNSQNLEDPFYILPLIWLHRYFEPSGWILRMIALVSGLLALLANWVLCRLVLGIRLAWISTLFLAVLPVAIAYSRFGWEPSQVLLFSVPVVYTSIGLSDDRRNLWIWLLMCGIACLGALLVHPTLGFLFLLPGLGMASRWIRPERGAGSACLVLALGVLGAAALGMSMYLKAQPWVQADIATRVKSCAWFFDVGHFAVAWIRNFNGINTFGFLPASWPGSSGIMNVAETPRLFVLDVIAFAAFAVAAGNIVFHLWKNGSDGPPEDNVHTVRAGVILLVGFVCASALFDIVSGPQKAAVWFDRYGLWSVVPGVVLVSMGLDAVSRACGRYVRACEAIGILICLFMLGMFWVKYFTCFMETGGRSGMDARVGPSEIKEQAADALEQWRNALDVREGKVKPILVSTDWFAYWAVVYFLDKGHRTRHWETVYMPATPDPAYVVDQATKDRIRNGRVAIVEYDSSEAWKQWEQFLPAGRKPSSESQIRDLTGQPILKVKFLQ